MTRRILYFAYGVASYAVFLVAFVYAIGFIGGFATPTALDGAVRDPLGVALAVNLGLLAVFAVQHSVMARQWFKRWWTRFVPEPIERSTYNLVSSLLLLVLYWQWRPMGGMVWDVQDPAGRALIWGFYAFGWLLLLVSTFLTNHFDLFGLRQVWLHLHGRPYTPLRFTAPFAYRLVRHPLYVGWLFIFWATPTMTLAHLVFAIMTTAYIVVAIQFEERDLVRTFGRRYADYRRAVPMLVPFTKRRGTRGPGRPGMNWKNVGTAGFAFFMIKGLVWLLAPGVIWLAR